MRPISIKLQVCGWCLFLALLLPVTGKPNNIYTDSALEVGDPCVMKNNIKGKCEVLSGCLHLEEVSKRLGLKERDVVRCGIAVKEEIICCPNVTLSTSRDKFGTEADDPVIKEPPAKSGRTMPGQKAKEACRLLSADDEPPLVPLVIGGELVRPGEYPHMVAIGYTSISNESQPYQFICGGSLIDKRFVLTAAHCLATHNLLARIVRLGVTDINDPQQQRDAIDIPIKIIHVHSGYNQLEPYNDIAIIELESDVEYNANVYPACLHTELADPPLSAELNVTGWGVVNIKTRAQSNKLLKARVDIFPLSRCQEFYANDSTMIKIKETQLCTRDETFMRDACWGDSGGPLNWIVDTKYRKMLIVGIISAGIGCAGMPPSLYTRVAAYIEFIEKIVWP